MKPLRAGGACIRHLILALAALPAIAAPPVIELSNADQQRLGIQFAAVAPNSTADGFQVPAQVINSPEQRAQITTFFSATLSRWYSKGGEDVRQGQVVAGLISAELMQLQEQWLAAGNHRRDMDQQLNKDKQLFADGIISELRLRQTQRAHRQALFSVQARRRQLLNAGVNDQDLAALQAGELAPGDYRLRSPRTGILSRRSWSVGDQLEANQRLATVTDSGALWLRASLPAALAQALESGDTLQIAGSSATVTLVSKNPELSPSTQQVGILARFNQAQAWLPGQQVALVLPSRRKGFRIPATAVTHREHITQVYIKHPKGIEVRELKLIPMGAYYLAVDNMHGDEQLVVQGSAQLKGIQLGLGGGE